MEHSREGGAVAGAPPRFVISIDLGTTNSAVAYADLREVTSTGSPRVRIFEVPQVVAEGEIYVFNDQPYTSIGLILNGQYQDQNSLFGLSEYDSKLRSFYSKLIFETKTEDEVHSITLGGSYVFDQYEEKFNGFDYFRKESRPGIFAEYNYSPIPQIAVVPGARVDFHNLYGTFFTPRLHIKYGINDNTTLRISGGKGYRSVNLLAENMNDLASSRQFAVINNPTYEEGWNYGFNLTTYFSINNRDLRVTADYYRTDFIKQTVVDVDTDVDEVRFYDLEGKSYSNNYQVELAYELISRLDLMTAFRYSDVKTAIGRILRPKRRRDAGCRSLR